MDQRPCCGRQHAQPASPSPGLWCYLAPEFVEITISGLCSVVTWEYTIQTETHESELGVHRGLHGSAGDANDFLFLPTPGLMLISCLVFGCCVSSFTHRRLSQDPFLPVVYLALLGFAALVGYRVQAHLHLIILGYIPWATCAAMALSFSGHCAYRWSRPDPSTRSPGDEEKASLLI
ncbi:hypothetical protein B0J18DRAFT_15416 [Chaetomium sp. MPI-SDFR-AT-0129]|nr:hypothetical protein B0J18DRAFT_15416 [Chaetomium sp. MPI-SDFR-AT-0129]